MALPIWDNNQGLRVRRTTSKDYLFLDATPEWIEKLAPFMELKEVGGIALPATESEDQGWLVPTSQFPHLYMFLEVAPSILTDTPIPPTVQGSKNEHPPVYWLTYTEFRMLMLLLPDRVIPFPNGRLNREAFHQASTYVQLTGVTFTSTKYLHGFSPFRPLENISEVRDIILRYLLNRGVVFKIGDLVRIQPSTVFIYDGTQLIAPEHYYSTTNVPLTRLPTMFKCPVPFPVMYFNFEEGIGDQVHPDFDRLEMEFDPTPPRNEELDKLATNYVALRCRYVQPGTSEPRTLYVYFLLEVPTRITFKRVTGWMYYREAEFFGLNNELIYTFLEPTDEELIEKGLTEEEYYAHWQ